jgi:hypothetical protein
MSLEIGQMVFSKTVKVKSEGASWIFKMKGKTEAISVLLGTVEKDNKFTQEQEDRAFRILGFIGFQDLLQYLPKKKVEEIEKAERKKFNIE